MAGGIRAQASCRLLLLRSPGRGFILGRRRAGGSPAVALSTSCRTSKIETHLEVLSRPREPKIWSLWCWVQPLRGFRSRVVTGTPPEPDHQNPHPRGSALQTQCLKLRAARKRQVWVRPEPKKKKKKWKWSWKAMEGPMWKKSSEMMDGFRTVRNSTIQEKQPGFLPLESFF